MFCSLSACQLEGRRFWWIWFASSFGDLLLRRVLIRRLRAKASVAVTFLMVSGASKISSRSGNESFLRCPAIAVKKLQNLFDVKMKRTRHSISQCLLKREKSLNIFDWTNNLIERFDSHPRVIIQ